MSYNKSRHGFTLVDLGAVIVLVAAGGTALLGLQPGEETALQKARRSARQVKDSTQVRGIVQALITWGQNNEDRYPLPSRIDLKNDTVADIGAAKDTSAHIMSLLIYNGFVPVEMLVSPVETNRRVAPWEDYEYDRPKAAVRPEKALWNPAFSADFTGEKKSGLSYAHLQPAGTRGDRWSITFRSAEVAVSMRGPQITEAATHDDRSVTPKFANEKSNTFGMFDPDKTKWSGNIGYNDNHVNFAEHAFSPGKAVPFDPKHGRVYKDVDEKERVDLMFFDEPDDPRSANDFLGIFTKAGEKPADFKAIWD